MHFVYLPPYTRYWHSLYVLGNSYCVFQLAISRDVLIIVIFPYLTKIYYSSGKLLHLYKTIAICCTTTIPLELFHFD